MHETFTGATATHTHIMVEFCCHLLAIHVQAVTFLSYWQVTNSNVSHTWYF